MTDMIPPARPRATREQVQARLTAAGVGAVVALVGSRGYYRDTMGAPGKNDRGIYDDALFLVSPETFSAFNANTDPTAQPRAGLAVLRAGLWRYRVGTHGLNRPVAQRYTALVQAGEVTVDRDLKGADTGFFGINIHRGGRNTTSSLGCQTIPPEQWPAFIALVQQELKRHAQKELPYLLLDGAP